MLTTAHKLRIVAAVFALLGLTCLPWPPLNPRSALNTFNGFADSGDLMPLFYGTVAIATLLFAISFLFRR